MQKSILGLTEVDMNENRGLYYIAPNFFMPSKNLVALKIAIKTKGYGTIKRENLDITIGFLGKSTCNTNINYKCDILDIIEGIALK